MKTLHEAAAKAVETARRSKTVDKSKWVNDLEVRAVFENYDEAQQVAVLAKVGDSRFESWYSELQQEDKSRKQIARAAYEAGMNEAQQVAVPAGWMLVPIEPTDAMCEAAWEGEGVDYIGEHKRIHRADLAYIRMLAAAQGAKP